MGTAEPSRGEGAEGRGVTEQVGDERGGSAGSIPAPGGLTSPLCSVTPPVLGEGHSPLDLEYRAKSGLDTYPDTDPDA